MGTILLIGGGVASADVDKRWLFEQMHLDAGGGTPKLAILSSSKESHQTAYDHFYKIEPDIGSFETNYRALGFEPIFIPLAVDNAEEIKNSPHWMTVLSACDGAYLQGGDQFKHIRSLLNRDGSPSLLLKALESILEKGGVVAGTSAGMAAMGDVAFGLGSSKTALSINRMEWRTIEALNGAEVLAPEIPDNILAVPGIGLVPHGIILDTHFDQRGRLGRLMVAMRDAKCTYGVGIDEATCLALKGHLAQVTGENGVTILDATEATYGAGDAFGVTNLKLHYLRAGDRFEFSK